MSNIQVSKKMEMGEKFMATLLESNIKEVEENLATATKEERLEIVNKLIHYISEHGRRFFYTKGTYTNVDIESVAFMKFKNGRLYFVDNYTETEIPMTARSNWDGFSHGGTLRALVSDFAEYIRTGKYSNGNNGYGGLYCSHWGHSSDIQQDIIDYAKNVGYLK